MSAVLSIVVATRGRHDGLRRLLGSLREDDDRARAVELVIVEDGPPYLAEPVEWPGRVEVLRHDERAGLAVARNHGIAASSAPLIGFLDDDGVCGPGWLDVALASFEDPTYAVMGGVVAPADGGSNLFSALRDQLYYREMFGTNYGPADLDHSADGDAFVHPAPYASGGNSVYRRVVFEECGVFNAALPASIDTEFGARLRGTPFQPFLNRRMVLVHQHPSKFVPYMERCFTAGATKGIVGRQGHLPGHPFLTPTRAGVTALSNLVWRNFRRARAVEGHSSTLLWGVLQIQDMVHIAGLLYGYLAGGRSKH